MNSFAIITGAGSGIGKATAEKFIANAYKVILVGRRLEPLQNIAKTYPDRAIALSCDIRSQTDLQKLNTEIQKHQNIEVLVNNAGIYEQKSFLESDHQHFVQMFEANFFSCVNVSRLVIPYFLQAKKGVIVNVSSTLGERPIAQTAAYSSTKAAMINLTKSLALELAPAKIRVNCICPGIVETPIHDLSNESLKAQMQTFQPLGRIGQPSEIAHHIFSFCAPGSEWTTGSVLDVDGGIHL
jgi:NAD(P)-dependent dehydrogenase (short-subunit alcohol dehydrogenase family)